MLLIFNLLNMRILSVFSWGSMALAGLFLASCVGKAPVVADYEVVPIPVEIDEKIDMKQSDEERARELNEQFYVSGYNLDVDRLVGNELTLNLPMKVLCREDCKGICNRCGTNLNYGTCDCDTRSLDPRMSVIQDIFKQLKEV